MGIIRVAMAYISNAIDERQTIVGRHNLSDGIYFRSR
jgi:hypothetical protein